MHFSGVVASIFDLQLSLSQRDPAQHETLPTTPCCVFKAQAEAATPTQTSGRQSGSVEPEGFGGEMIKVAAFPKVLIEMLETQSQIVLKA